MKFARLLSVATLMLLLSVLFTSSFAQTSGETYPDGDAANATYWKQCAGKKAGDGATGPCQWMAPGSIPQCVISEVYGCVCLTGDPYYPAGQYLCWGGLVGAYQPQPTCSEGTMIGSGTTYQFNSSTGQASYNGCCLSLLLGGPNSGSEVENGQACLSGGTNTTPKQPSEKSNPDGSKTYCDQVSGQCVTSYPPGDGPASGSSSSGPNNTSSSDTDNYPGSSSSSGGSGSGSGGTSGSGSGSGSGTTSSGGDTPASTSSTTCSTGVCDVGNADGSVGTLYTPSSDTPSSVYSAFASSVQSAPIMSTVTGFFQLSASGSCPVWTLPASKFVPAQTFDYFCQPGVESMLQLAGVVMLALGAYCAFRIAIY